MSASKVESKVLFYARPFDLRDDVQGEGEYVLITAPSKMRDLADAIVRRTTAGTTGLLGVCFLGDDSCDSMTAVAFGFLEPEKLDAGRACEQECATRSAGLPPLEAMAVKAEVYEEHLATWRASHSGLSFDDASAEPLPPANPPRDGEGVSRVLMADGGWSLPTHKVVH